MNIKCKTCGSMLKLPEDYRKDAFDGVLRCEHDGCGDHWHVVIKDGRLLRRERVSILKGGFLKLRSFGPFR